MGFFNKLFGNTEKETTNKTMLSAQLSLPCKTEEELLEKFAGIALEKQFDFAELIGNNNWNADMIAGTISFGENLIFPIQEMGTFSHSSKTWLWAWANTQVEVAETLLQQALQLKKYGEDNDIPLLKNDRFDFSAHELHLLGMIAVGMFDADAYYIADYGQGAMLVTITDEKIKQARNDTSLRIPIVFPQLISQFELNHKNALKSYLLAKGFEVTETSTTLQGSKDGKMIRGEFDEQSRLINLKG